MCVRWLGWCGVVGWSEDGHPTPGPRGGGDRRWSVVAGLGRTASARPAHHLAQQHCNAAVCHDALNPSCPTALVPPLQETCTKLVQQQQLCHEQQEELHFLRLKYQELSARLEAAEAAATAAGSNGNGGGGGWSSLAPAGRTPAQHPAVQQLSRQGSQGSAASAGSRPLERPSPSGSADGSRLVRTGSGSSGGGGKLSSWLGLRRG